jgi:hypothetical protein
VELETIIWGNYIAEFTIYMHRQRPELETLLSTSGDVWPEFIFDDEIARRYLHHTDTTFAHPNLYSMVIRGKVEEWESWTKMRFPESGSYVVPGALQPISINCERNEGIYMEPNVWVRHSHQAA